MDWNPPRVCDWQPLLPAKGETPLKASWGAGLVDFDVVSVVCRRVTTWLNSACLWEAPWLSIGQVTCVHLVHRRRQWFFGVWRRPSTFFIDIIVDVVLPWSLSSGVWSLWFSTRSVSGSCRRFFFHWLTFFTGLRSSSPPPGSITFYLPWTGLNPLHGQLWVTDS